MINRYLPRKSRGATLAIMAEMDQCPGRRLGVDKETHCNLDHRDVESTRTQYHQMSPRNKEAPQRLPTTWPQCLARGAPTCSFRPPSPTPSSTSSNLLEPPSLESLTKPESGYEALVSSALSSNTD